MSFLRKNHQVSVLSLVLFLSLSLVQAQDAPEPYPKVSQALDLALGTNAQVFSGALSFQRHHGLLKRRQLRLGYGLRFHGLGAAQADFLTAPAKLTAEPSNMDTLRLDAPLALGLSALVSIEYQVLTKLKLGFNIDAVGLGFGRSAQGAYFAQSQGANFPANVEAKPTTLNLLLVGDRDFGQLKSEFFIAYAPTEKLWLRLGLDMTFIEYTTNQALRNDNDRFRHKAMLPFLAVSLNL